MILQIKTDSPPINPLMKSDSQSREKRLHILCIGLIRHCLNIFTSLFVRLGKQVSSGISSRVTSLNFYDHFQSSSSTLPSLLSLISRATRRIRIAAKSPPCAVRFLGIALDSPTFFNLNCGMSDCF